MAGSPGAWLLAFVRNQVSQAIRRESTIGIRGVGMPEVLTGLGLGAVV